MPLLVVDVAFHYGPGAFSHFGRIPAEPCSWDQPPWLKPTWRRFGEVKRSVWWRLLLSSSVASKNRNNMCHRNLWHMNLMSMDCGKIMPNHHSLSGLGNLLFIPNTCPMTIRPASVPSSKPKLLKLQWVDLLLEAHPFSLILQQHPVSIFPTNIPLHSSTLTITVSLMHHYALLPSSSWPF